MDNKKQLLHFASPRMSARLHELGLPTDTTYYYVRYLGSEVSGLDTQAFDKLGIYADFSLKDIKKDYIKEPAYSIADMLEILPKGTIVIKERNDWYGISLNPTHKIYGDRLADVMAECIITLVAAGKLDVQSINYLMNKIYGK